jgi:Xaa-Pro aminopeptidase
MKNKGLDGLVVVGFRYGEPLDRYLSNWIPGCIVIFPLEAPPTLLARMIPEMFALRSDMPEKDRPWIEDIRPGIQGGAIITVLREKGLDRSRVGVVGTDTLRTDWGGWIPFRTWNRVVSGLPECSFEDATAAFAELVLVKSDEELVQVRQAAQVLELACKEMVKTVRSGVTELEVYSTIQSVLSKNGVYAPNLILRSGPDNISWGQPPWLFGVGSPRILEPGDIVQAEIFAWCGGLEAQVQMSVAIPPVSSANNKCAQLARQTYEEGLQHLKAGKKFAEVVAAMEAVLDSPGVWHLTPLIHSMNPMVCIGPTGVGIESLPGVEAYRQVGTSRIRGADIVLEPGMVFELEPNACIKRHRVNIGGTVIVTERVAEPLNQLSTEMRLAGEA